VRAKWVWGKGGILRKKGREWVEREGGGIAGLVSSPT